jgi:hypothetical protein
MADPARELLFAFPPQGRDGVRFYMETDHVPGTNVIESYYRLEVVKNGEKCSYRLPHDMEQLWSRLSQT